MPSRHSRRRTTSGWRRSSGKVTADVVTEEKVDRINRALDEQKRVMDQLVLKGRRPALGGGGASSAATIEHKAAFEAYIRGGAEENLRSFERKALSVSTNSGADGGYTVPDDIEREIGRRLASVSPIRAISGVRQISGNVYKKPFAISGAATGWVAEADLARADQHADAGRAAVSGNGALRHAGGDRHAARRQRSEHRRMDRRRGRAGVRDAGRRGIRQWRRRRRADRLLARHQDRRGLVGVDQDRLRQDRASRRASPPTVAATTISSTSSTR